MREGDTLPAYSRTDMIALQLVEGIALETIKRLPATIVVELDGKTKDGGTGVVHVACHEHEHNVVRSR